MARRRSVVLPLLAGAALSVGGAACTAGGPGGPVVTSNPPPPPEPDEVQEVGTPESAEEMIATNPPPPELEGEGPTSALPTWDAVESGHPEGATNPPMPVLIVQADGERCWKDWSDPRRMDREVMTKGGKVVDDASGAEGATEITCPDNASEVLAKHAEDDGPTGLLPPPEQDGEPE